MTANPIPRTVYPRARDQQALPHVVGSVYALRNLPHHTILRVQTVWRDG